MRPKSVNISTYRLGEKAAGKGSLRIGAVRFPPRGVKKAGHAKFFDIRLPLIAPSKKLISSYMKSARRERAWPRFSKAYEKEIKKDRAAMIAIALLAEISRSIPVALGCYCEEEKICHRSVLKKLVMEAVKG